MYSGTTYNWNLLFIRGYRVNLFIFFSKQEFYIPKSVENEIQGTACKYKRCSPCTHVQIPFHLLNNTLQSIVLHLYLNQCSFLSLYAQSQTPANWSVSETSPVRGLTAWCAPAPRGTCPPHTSRKHAKVRRRRRSDLCQI